MGFSSALQGRAAHEALIVRQDAELRLMDTMKRSIQMKAKCDKEYAVSLAAVAQQGLKIDRADDMQGSHITKSWRTYMEELDQQAKQFKTNAELLEVVCEKISHLSQDKRKARKAYQEEHAKIAARLNHLTDEVVRKKSEYQKHLEGYKALRTRFEEHYIKSGRGGRKLDDVRDKYQKACRKLHLTHNEYVLSITEAIEVEKDFRTVLLPGLLEHQQSVQESFILLWRNILQETSQHGDLTSDKFKEIQKRIDNVINNINPSEEYREFTEKHKTSPTTPLVFQFDESLIEDIPGKLQSSTLTVDNLTVDWLRSRQLDLELAVKDCQEKQVKMIEHVNGGSPIANGSITSNGGHNNSNGIQSNKDSQNRQSKDLNALRCQEKQKQKLVDMIKCALNEVGCEELPSGCDDHLTLDQSFIENGFNNDQQASNMSTTSNSNNNNVSIMNELMRRGGVLTLLRGPFKRKSTPQPQTPTARARTQNIVKLQPRSQSLGSLSVNTSPAKYEPITNPLRMAASVEATHTRSLHMDLDSGIDVESMVVFARGTGEVLPKLRRTQLSMLCLLEEPCGQVNPKACVATHVLSMLCKDTNTNTNSNNNNIYSDLELLDTGGIDQKFAGDCESVTSGDVPPPTPQLTAEQLLRRQQLHVKIEINREDSMAALKKPECESEQPAEPTGPSQHLETITPVTEQPIKNSIDAHLDKIDELNRTLDNRLKRNLPRLPSRPANMDLDAIETTETRLRSTDNLLLGVAGGGTASKRASSSSSDSKTHVSRKDEAALCSAANGKKRSMSFSNKSINALLSNIREFSRSPLARMQKSHHATLTEDCEINDILDGVAELSMDAKATNETLITDLTSSCLVTEPVNIACLASNHTPCSSTQAAPTAPPLPANNTAMHNANNTNPSTPTTQTNTSSKLKFKVPKIQKKSKAIRNTFRSKLMNFQIKRGKLCKTCTKRRRIHPSKSVFDFAKEFNMTSVEDDFCTCPPVLNSVTQVLESRNNSSVDAEEDDENSDDVLSMKDHCYCVPSLSMSVSSGGSSIDSIQQDILFKLHFSSSSYSYNS